MQASDTKDASRAALYTSLKCGIPVAALAGFVMLCFYMPDEALKALGFVWGYVADAGMLVMIWLGAVERALSNVIYHLGAVVILGYLWSACALNNLKAKGLTGSLYLKLTKVYVFLGFTLLISMLLWFWTWVNQMVSIPSIGGMYKLWLWLGIGIFLAFVGGYTSSKNNNFDSGATKDEQ